MTPNEAWDYISKHQDDDQSQIAKALNIQPGKALDLIYSWSLGDRDEFNKQFEGTNESETPLFSELREANKDIKEVEEGETPLFIEFKDNKSTPSFADFVDERRAIKSLPYLNESENAQVNEFVDLFESECDNDINLLDEGFLGKIVGGVAGFLVGPTIGRIVANALGIERGILYDMFTSRLVSTALGAAIAKSVGKTPAR